MKNTNHPTITLKVEGMTCTNCALGINKTLEKKGLTNVYASFSDAEVSFDWVESDKVSLEEIKSLITDGGFQVIDENVESESKSFFSFDNISFKFYLSAFFSIPLLLHMFVHWHILHHPIFQLLMALVPLYIGVFHFGKSALQSVKSGVPNMDVLIFIGSTSAFLYSLAGTIYFYGTPQVNNYLFYETSATIITLVLLGNLMEHRSVKQTTSAISDLTKMQVTTSKKVIDLQTNNIEEVEVSSLKKGDIISVNEGDKIPVDGFVFSGNLEIDESMISGENEPIYKELQSNVIAGTIVKSGNAFVKTEKIGSDTVLAKIIKLVKEAQRSQPNIQRLGDRVSAIFVPVVVIISLITFLVWYFVLDASIAKSLMNSVAVLVISCPCAMGLATPTAVMVGLGRAAKNGILIKGGATLEQYAAVDTFVFDKTGTLTTGDFKIKNVVISEKYKEQLPIQEIIFHLEQYSSHPIAKSIVKVWKEDFGKNMMLFKSLKEEKGLGIKAISMEGDEYFLGSFKVLKQFDLGFLDGTENFKLFLIKNKELIAALEIEDEIIANAKEMISSLKKMDKKVILLSGDKEDKCHKISAELGIEKYFSEKSPEDKLKIIEDLNKNNKVAMVGDGINDAPALAKAQVGISLGHATDVAINTSKVVLLNKHDLMQLVKSYQLSKHTLLTIKQNLFWAFFYNVVAIPIAAAGFLNPMIAALTMAFSDVIVVGNSIRLKYKKIF
jgi:P-type Cu+ transporter